MSNIPKFRTAYDYEFGDRGDIIFPDDEPSLADQSAKDECDINLIIDRANRGMMPPISERIPSFGDFTEVPDFQTMQNMVIQAQEEFEALPSAIRNRFDNEPAKLLAFLANSENREEAIRLGLIEEPPVAASAAGSPAEPGGNASEVVSPPAAA